MERSCYYLCVCYGFFMFLLNKGSSESITVEVVQGDSVILPCSAGGNEKDIFWRHNNTKTVYDIIESKEDFDDQDAAFRGRVEGFPSKFTEVYPKRSQHPDMQQNGGVDIQPVNLLCFSAALLGLSVLLF
ncbi:uncharacterized protein LOC124380006 isoform X3 [Silurus meridionalis]|uniref:uncharacterized protein LOC124380006 isoform X3 n=1 Tax=Silurus meridionalis TaxID=175797 RepID=UPI001EEA3243|nr:uncharacterized protein LOC124380006 isoform X3 [Silurus meridionalis]